MTPNHPEKNAGTFSQEKKRGLQKEKKKAEKERKTEKKKKFARKRKGRVLKREKSKMFQQSEWLGGGGISLEKRGKDTRKRGKDGERVFRRTTPRADDDSREVLGGGGKSCKGGIRKTTPTMKNQSPFSFLMHVQLNRGRSKRGKKKKKAKGCPRRRIGALRGDLLPTKEGQSSGVNGKGKAKKRKKNKTEIINCLKNTTGGKRRRGGGRNTRGAVPEGKDVKKKKESSGEKRNRKKRGLENSALRGEVGPKGALRKKSGKSEGGGRTGKEVWR